MKATIARRFIRLLITLLVVSFLTSSMFELLPGDPALSIVSADTFNVNPESIEAARKILHLDQPFYERYARWLGNAVQGDFGESFRTHQPVSDALWERLPITLELMIMAQLFAIAFALLVAPLAAWRPGKWFDRSTTMLSFGLLSIPSFVGGLFLIYVVAVRFDLLTSTGFTHLSDGVVENIKSMLLPSLTLAAGEGAVYARLLRAEMVNTLDEDYVLMARANGLSTPRILLRHALRPSALPLITILGVSIGGLIGGSVIVESLFGLPGLGRLAVDSIENRDVITLQGVVAVVALGYVLINFIVDLSYIIADPRIRHAPA